CSAAACLRFHTTTFSSDALSASLPVRSKHTLLLLLAITPNVCDSSYRRYVFTIAQLSFLTSAAALRLSVSPVITRTAIRGQRRGSSTRAATAVVLPWPVCAVPNCDHR